MDNQKVVSMQTASLNQAVSREKHCGFIVIIADVGIGIFSCNPKE